MPFVIDDIYLPATITASPMTDGEFAAFCAEHPDLFFEMTAEGEIIVMPPTYTTSDASCSRIGARLAVWAEQDGRGISCGSSAGYVLPNGARRSPDASWTLKSRINALDRQSRDGFWHLCPDFVIELQSSTDRPRLLREKMEEYMANGAQLGWLINPKKRSVAIYRPDRAVETLEGIDKVGGDGLVAGFVLELSFIWNPLEG
jgi:Uma2 family endonuclease